MENTVSKIYYVDYNTPAKKEKRDGIGWETAFKTPEEALDAMEARIISHAKYGGIVYKWAIDRWREI